MVLIFQIRSFVVLQRYVNSFKIQMHLLKIV